MRNLLKKLAHLGIVAAAIVGCSDADSTPMSGERDALADGGDSGADSADPNDATLADEPVDCGLDENPTPDPGWSWAWGETSPAPIYEAPQVTMACTVAAANVDSVSPFIVFSLTCTDDKGGNFETSLRVSLAHDRLLQASLQPDALRVEYLPELICPNGCRWGGGWLTIRDEADTLLFGAIDAASASPKSDFFAPFSIEEGETLCEEERAHCDDQNAEPARFATYEVVISSAGEEQRRERGTTVTMGEHRVEVIEALRGRLASCVNDGGSPNSLIVRIE